MFSRHSVLSLLIKTSVRAYVALHFLYPFRQEGFFKFAGSIVRG